MGINYDEMGDEELIRDLREGNLAVLEYLLDKYKGMVRKKARALFLVGGDTDDLIQEGMIGLFKAIRDFRQERDTTFRTFASLCVDRQLYTAVQNSLRQKHLPLNSYVSLNQDGPEESLEGVHMESPEDILIRREQDIALLQELEEILTPMERRVLSLYLSGDSYQEIAGIIGRTPKSVDNALHRVRRKVRERMALDGRKAMDRITVKETPKGTAPDNS